MPNVPITAGYNRIELFRSQRRIDFRVDRDVNTIGQTPIRNTSGRRLNVAVFRDDHDADYRAIRGARGNRYQSESSVVDAPTRDLAQPLLTICARQQPSARFERLARSTFQ